MKTIIDLKTKSVKRGKTYLIKNGKPISNFKIRTSPVTFSEIEDLYETYKYSVPDGTRSKRPYFYALGPEQIPTIKMINGANRQKAKEDLELTLLMGILNKSLKWPNQKQWFWQSEKDKDLILLREWFTPV